MSSEGHVHRRKRRNKRKGFSTKAR